MSVLCDIYIYIKNSLFFIFTYNTLHFTGVGTRQDVAVNVFLNVLGEINELEMVISIL